MLVHLEHRAAVLAEDLLQLVVGQDLALVRRILQVVLPDMVPDLADDLAARQRIRTGDRGEVRRRRHRTLQTALPTLCHASLPVVSWADRERKSSPLAMGRAAESGRFSARSAAFSVDRAQKVAQRRPNGHHLVGRVVADVGAAEIGDAGAPAPEADDLLLAHAPKSGSLGRTSLTRPSRIPATRADIAGSR